MYIAQVKHKCGIIERKNYNKEKSGDAKGTMCICNVGVDFYNQVTVLEIEQQLKMMIGVVYDYEAKHCVHNEMIKQCMKKLLKMSGVFTDKEIERLLL